MRSDSFDVVIIPPSGIAKKAIPLSRKLKKEGGLFSLNRSTYSTHISLYMTEFPVKNLSAIKEKLKRIAAKSGPFRIQSIQYRQSKDGYVAVDFKRNKEIAALQKKIILALNPLREGLLRKKDVVRLKQLPKAQVKNIKKYGFRGALSDFHPHLTLTKLATHKKDVSKFLPQKDFSFSVGEIGMFYLGEHGGCKKLFAKFKLKKS